MNIHSLLPLWNGYRWVSRDVDLANSPQVISPGGTFNLLDDRVGMGWAVEALVRIDNPYTSLVIEWDDSKIISSPYQANMLGLRQHLPFGIWSSRYSTEVSPMVFVVLFTPTIPLSFERRFRVFLHNPATRPDGTANSVSQVHKYSVSIIEIYNEEAYRDSIKGIFPAHHVVQPPVQPPVEPPVGPPVVPRWIPPPLHRPGGTY